MRMYILCLVLLFALGCKNSEKQKETEIPAQEVTKERDINDFFVFENLLMKEDIEGAMYKNIKFTKGGALFSGEVDNPSYIELPKFEMDLSKGYNISFSFNSKTEDGTKPQTFISFTDKYSSPIRSIPLFIYLAGKRITGVYGDQKLWAEDYNKDLGESKTYYDSYQLSANEFYFVSINFSKSKIDFFVNGELYATFENILPHSNKFEKVVIGALPQGDNHSILFNGEIHGFKIFNITLTEKEMISVYNKQPYL